MLRRELTLLRLLVLVLFCWNVATTAYMLFEFPQEPTPAKPLRMDTLITVWEHEGEEPTATVSPGGAVRTIPLAQYVDEQVRRYEHDIDDVRELKHRTDYAAELGEPVPTWLHEWADNDPGRPVEYGQFSKE